VSATVSAARSEKASAAQVSDGRWAARDCKGNGAIADDLAVVAAKVDMLQ
jgi:hypothetical protein